MNCPKCNTKMKVMQECAYGDEDLPMSEPYFECPKCGQINNPKNRRLRRLRR